MMFKIYLNGLPKLGVPFGRPFKDYGIWKSIVGSPIFMETTKNAPMIAELYQGILKIRGSAH